MNNISSDELTISCGVPQGSVLGPLLFLIYVNDLANCSKLLEFNLYADDSNLFYKSNTLLSLQTNLNKELAEVYKWLCVNKLSLNIKKSNFVIFHPRQRKIETNVQIVINQQLSKQELSIKYLRVTLDSELKIKRSIRILSKLRYYINLSTLKNLYYPPIYSFLIYGILVWGYTYQATLHLLVILQKRMIRIITFTDYYEHTSPLFKSLNILKIRFSILSCCCICEKIS